MELQHARITFDYQMKAHPSVIKKLYAFNPWALETQQRIAEILSTVDEAIEQTGSLIEKIQQIKAGLMHDLFTRGVTADGWLRPRREEAPQLYKESSLGWIPREWNCELLDNLADRGSGHTPNRNIASYWNGGVKWVSLADSYRLDQLYIDDTEHENQSSRNSKLLSRASSSRHCCLIARCRCRQERNNHKTNGS